QRAYLLATVDLPADMRDRLLIDGGGVPGLDDGEIRLARLIAGAGFPTVRLEEVRRRVQRIRRDVETAAAAVGENVLRQKLGLADLAVHRAALARGDDPAIDQLQRRNELVGEIFRPPTVICKRRNRRERVLVAMLRAERRFHPPDRDQRSRRDAIFLLDRGKQRRMRLLHGAPARRDRGAAALDHELLKGQLEAALTAVSVDRRLRVLRSHQGRDAGLADSLRLRLRREGLLPGLEAAGAVAALRGVGRADRAKKDSRNRQGSGSKLLHEVALNR